MYLSKLDLPDKIEVSIICRTFRYTEYYKGTWRDFKSHYSIIIPKLNVEEIIIHSNTAVIKCRLNTALIKSRFLF